MAAASKVVYEGSGAAVAQPLAQVRVVSAPSASTGLSGEPSKSANLREEKFARLGGESGSDVFENAVPVLSSKVNSMERLLSVEDVPVSSYSSSGPGRFLLTVMFTVFAENGMPSSAPPIVPVNETIIAKTPPAPVYPPL